MTVSTTLSQILLANALIAIALSMRFRRSVARDVLRLAPRITDDETLRMIKKAEKLGGDVIVVSYPKSGTHLMSFACWLLMSDGQELTENFHGLVPFLDKKSSWVDGKLLAPPIGDSKRRLYFSHLKPEWLLANANDDTRYVYMVRHPRDVLSSFHTMLSAIDNSFGGFEGSLDDFTAHFCQEGLMYGSWVDNVRSWVQRAEVDSRVLIVRFEDLVGNQTETLRRVNRHIRGVVPATFGQPICPTEARIMKYLSFEWMKQHSLLFQMRSIKLKNDKFQLVNKGKVNSSALSDGANKCLHQYLLEKCPPDIARLVIGNPAELEL